MPEACEPADVLLVVPFLYVSCEEKRRPEISLRSQGITLAFSAEFLQFLGELACPGSCSVQMREKSRRAVKERAGEKQWEERRGEPVGILTNITVHQLLRPLPEKPFFVSK